MNKVMIEVTRILKTKKRSERMAARIHHSTMSEWINDANNIRTTNEVGL